MKIRLTHLLGLATLSWLLTGTVQAAPVFTNSAVVNSPAHTATFTGISGSLLGYTEDGIVVSVDDNWCCYSDVH